MCYNFIKGDDFKIMSKKCWLFLDDSGQLSNNGTHNYFLYGGVFIPNEKKLNELRNKINNQKKFLGITKEIKGASIKNKHRKKLLQVVKKIEDIETLFLIEHTPSLNRVDFENHYSVRMHKNYLVKRLIEQLHNKNLIDDDTTLYIYIDNEALSGGIYKDSLQNHLNAYYKRANKGAFLKHFEYTSFIPSFETQFKVKYIDSRSELLMQVADLLANTKYRRYKLESKDGSEHIKCPLVCLKLPIQFRSGKEKIV